MLEYFRADELPDWQATVSINGTTPDFSTGWTFTVKLATNDSVSPTLTKSTNITGAANGVITVAWATTDLDQTPGEYVAHLTATRTSDSRQATVQEVLLIKPRL